MQMAEPVDNRGRLVGSVVTRTVDVDAYGVLGFLGSFRTHGGVQ